MTEGEDDDIEWGSEVLTEAATAEHNKGEDQELFFFFGGDVSLFLNINKQSVDNHSFIKCASQLLVIICVLFSKHFEVPIKI